MTDTSNSTDTNFFRSVIVLADRWYPLIIIVLAIIIIFPGLGEGSLRDWDEAIYAQVSREIIQSGDWINLHHGYEPYFEKPPLLMWIITIFYKLFGVNEFWSRAPSAISGVSLVYITYLIGTKIYERCTGFLAGLILLGCYEFVWNSRNGTTNMLLTLIVFTGIFGYLHLRDGNQKWFYLIFASCALAFMVKFWAGLVLPLALMLTLLLEGHWINTLKSKHFWLGLLLGGIIVIPWFLLAYLQNGQILINAYITRNLMERSLTSMEGHHGTPFFYFDFMRRRFSPWYFLIPYSFALGIKEIIESQRKTNILIIEILLLMGIYTFVVNTKRPMYILPIYPALSILIAHFFKLAFTTFKSDVFIYVISATLAATVMFQDKLLIICILVGIGLIILIKMAVLPKDRVFVIISGLIFVVFLMTSFIGYVLGNHRLPFQSIYGLQVAPVAKIAPLTSEVNSSGREPIIGLAMPEDWDSYYAVEGPTAIFYSNRPVDVAFSWERFNELLFERGSGEIIMAEKYLDRFTKDFDIFIVEKVEPLVYIRFRLQP